MPDKDPIEGVERGKNIPDRPAKQRPPISRRQICPECGELAAIPSDHLPSCSLSIAVVGTYLPTVNALLDATGSTPIKLMLHADGSVSWRPLFGRPE